MKTLLALSFLACTLNSFSQKEFVGKIEYKVQFIGEGVEQFEALAAHEYLLWFAPNKMRYEMKGGMMAAMMGRFITLGDEMYMIKDNEQIAYHFTTTEGEDADAETPTIKKTSETKTILGYSCVKYILSQTIEGQATQTNLWVTNQLTPPIVSTSTSNSGGLIQKGIPGMALQMQTEMMGILMVITATSIDPTLPANSVFEWPKSYEIQEFDPAALMGGSGQ